MKFRKYKCTTYWIDSDTNALHSAQRIINLFDVSDYEEFKDEKYGNKPMTLIHMESQKPSIVIAESTSRFEQIHDEFMADYGIIDDRSIKKKNRYSGFVRFHFFIGKKDIVGYMFDNKHNPNEHTTEENFNSLLSKHHLTYN